MLRDCFKNLKKINKVKSVITVIFLLICSTSANEAPLPVLPKPKASFLIAYVMIESYEGGYANVANDLGEETYCGISRKFSKEWTGWHHIDEYKKKNGPPEWNHHFDGITDWLVIDFYVDIWVKEGFFDLENQVIANYLFDFRVHSPIGVKLIQQQLNEFGFGFKLDNKMNPEMTGALNKINPEPFLKSLRAKRIDFYRQIVAHDPTQKKFLLHWLKRANA